MLQIGGTVLFRPAHVLGGALAWRVSVRISPLMAGASPWHNEALDRTGAKVVAVERDGAVVMAFEHGFLVQPDDIVFICGSVNSLGRYQREFRAGPAPARPAAVRAQTPP